MVEDPKNKAAEEQAWAQLESIREMVKALKDSEKLTADDQENARQAIEEDPLEVSVRDNWYSPGSEAENKPTDFSILLCTGGPAVRIVGELSAYGEPERVKIQFQDWFTGWESLWLTAEEEADVLTYARCFYYED